MKEDVAALRRAIAVLLAVGLLVAADLVVDDKTGAEPGHLILEGVLMVISLGGAGSLWWGLRRARVEVAELELDVAVARQEAARWRGEAREALEGLGVSIGRQFDRWQLTQAERDVALLLLKGLSHHEVARVREVSERTARQQARAVYRKAGLSGRSELAAFFLEDLLVPATDPASEPS
ncbi:MAG: LuxR C-terminal-related transcriptional regulator [Gemmatimonadota bacterium]|jgi:DNA-binding CsgD family transcriptional regulator